MSDDAGPPRVAILFGPELAPAELAERLPPSRRAAVDAAPDETLSLADYHLFAASLDAGVRRAVEAGHGAPETDPAYRPGETDCGAFRLGVRTAGRTAVALVEAETGPPCPADLALAAWLAAWFRPDRVLCLGAGRRLAGLLGGGVAVHRLPARASAMQIALALPAA